ncbi:Formate/nitrite transporter [Acephala macrosclerotiorum]|nr:Formate/nitrite transporter [Acephala macrosclerotiorum]
MDAFSPAQTIELISRMGTKKANMRIDKMIINSIMGGLLLGFGCALNLSTLSSPWFQTNAPGLIRTIGACFFPVGLIMVFLTGADLFTSYCMYSVVALLHRRITILDLAKTWGVSFFCNLAGILFSALILFGYGGVFKAGAFNAEVISFATAKVVTPAWHQIFLRAILANWLVTMAVFLSTSSREIASKIISIWFPTMAFTALGADHVIANMFYIPVGIFSGAPISVGFYIWKSMIPAALGNIVGGGVFVGVVYCCGWTARSSPSTLDPTVNAHKCGGHHESSCDRDGQGIAWFFVQEFGTWLQR